MPDGATDNPGDNARHIDRGGDFSAAIAKMLTLQNVASAFSMIGSLSVIATLLVFSKHLLARKTFMSLLLWACVSDFLSGVANCFGFPSGALCYMQGGLIYFFTRSTWFWVCTMSFELYWTMAHGKFFFTPMRAHVLVWTTSALLSFLVFSTNNYGQDDELTGNFVCEIYFGHQNKGALTGGVWETLTFWVPLFLVMCTMSFFAFRITRDYKNNKHPLIKAACRTMFYYPVILIVTYLPNCILRITNTIGYLMVKDFDISPLLLKITLFNTFNSFATLYGLFMAFLYFYNAKEARQRWSDLFFHYYNKFYPPKDVETEEQISAKIIRHIGETDMFDDDALEKDVVLRSSLGLEMATMDALSRPSSTSSEVLDGVEASREEPPPKTNAAAAANAAPKSLPQILESSAAEA